MTRPGADLFLALIAILLWSSVASAFKIALEGFSPLQLLLLASWTSCGSLAVLISFISGWESLWKQKSRDWWNSILLGFLNPFLYYQLLFNAYRILPGHLAQPLNYTWPILFSLFAVPLLGKKLTWPVLIGLSVSFVGVMWLSLFGSTINAERSHFLGCVYALGSAAIWSLFWIINLKDPRPSLQKLFSGFLFGSILITTFTSLAEDVFFPGMKSFLAAVYIGLFEMGITFVVWLHALEISKRKNLIANMAYLSPFVSLVLLHWVIGESITFSSVFGLILVVGGIVIQSRQ